MFFVDSHCHLEFPEFEEDFEAILTRAIEANVKTLLSIGTRPAGWPKIRALAETHPEIFATIGLHPTDIEPELLPDLAERLFQESQHPRVVGFGETGLDFYHKPYDLDQQIQSLEAHCSAALKADLPVVIHTREAAAETTACLKKACARGRLRGVIHCFSENLSFAKDMLDLGFYISFSGIVTFKNATSCKEVARFVPLERLLIETDAPFLAPQPFRGKRNEPSFVIHTAQKIADLRGISLEKVAHQTTENFFTLFSKAKRA